MLIISTKNDTGLLAARERAAGELVFVEKDDDAALRRLVAEATGLVTEGKEKTEGGREECFLVLQDMTSLWLLQTVGLPRELEERVDVCATTWEDWLAKTVFVRLPGVRAMFPSLDRVAIGRDSEVTVHLVIVGFSALTEALAMNAALVAHYPNYNRDARLRTRITVVDEKVHEGRDRLVQRYVHLFDNSYWRTLDLDDASPRCVVHRPMYEGKRKDFVDIEWEFVKGNVRNEAVRQKLTEWSEDGRQQLTVALCHQEQERNYSEAFGLPEGVYRMGVPVLCWTEGGDLLRMAAKEGAYASIVPMGSDLLDMSVLRVLKKLAKRVNYVYSHCFSLAKEDPITAPATIDEEKMERLWTQVGSLTKQYSNLFNAMTLGTKMHSIGHAEGDWKDYYALTMEEISVLTEVEHNRWSVEELILGYRPANDEEMARVEKDIAQKKVLRKEKIHYDLRSFDDLRADSTGKNVNVYDMALTQGIPLIIKSCITD